MSWAVPVITGYKYKFHWEYGVDFMKMEIDLSERWQPNDYGVMFNFNFSDVRAAVTVMAGPALIPNYTLNTTKSDWAIGDNVILNDTATRMISLYIDGSNATRGNITM